MNLLPFLSSETRDLAFVAQHFGGKVLRNGAFGNLGMFRNAGVDMATIFYNEQFRPQFEENISRFSCVLTTAEIAPTLPAHMGVLVAEKPLDIFLKLHFHFCEKEPEFYTRNMPAQISPDADIHSSAVLPKHNIIVEAGAVIRPHVVIEENTFIGRNCFIGPGVAIGGPGFEMRYIDGVMTYVPHAGGVTIGEGSHLLANSCVARSVFGGATLIGKNCKFDQIVHIAHAAQIGDNCRLAASASIGGATQLGNDVWVGPNAAVSNSLRIGAEAWIAMGASVVRDVAPGARVSGLFARPMP